MPTGTTHSSPAGDGEKLTPPRTSGALKFPRGTTDGTLRLATRNVRHPADFYRTVPRALTASALGLGTYLGECTDAEDDRYRKSIREALGSGINVIDTAINYRCQRSERAVGSALNEAFSAGEIDWRLRLRGLARASRPAGQQATPQPVRSGCARARHRRAGEPLPRRPTPVWSRDARGRAQPDTAARGKAGSPLRGGRSARTRGGRQRSVDARSVGSRPAGRGAGTVSDLHDRRAAVTSVCGLAAGGFDGAHRNASYRARARERRRVAPGDGVAFINEREQASPRCRRHVQKPLARQPHAPLPRRPAAGGGPTARGNMYHATARIVSEGDSRRRPAEGRHGRTHRDVDRSLDDPASDGWPEPHHGSGIQ